MGWNRLSQQYFFIVPNLMIILGYGIPFGAYPMWVTAIGKWQILFFVSCASQFSIANRNKSNLLSHFNYHLDFTHRKTLSYCVWCCRAVGICIECTPIKWEFPASSFKRQSVQYVHIVIEMAYERQQTYNLLVNRIGKCFSIYPSLSMPRIISLCLYLSLFLSLPLSVSFFLSISPPSSLSLFPPLFLSISLFILLIQPISFIYLAFLFTPLKCPIIRRNVSCDLFECYFQENRGWNSKFMNTEIICLVTRCG